MLVGYLSGTFGLHRAYEMIQAGTATRILVISPELTTPQVNYCDRDSHFIFGYTGRVNYTKPFALDAAFHQNNHKACKEVNPIGTEHTN